MTEVAATTSLDSGRVLLQEKGMDGVLHLRLNRPEKRNALNGQLVEALTEALETASSNPEIRVLVLSGRGKDFCSGADLKELEALAEMGVEDSLADAQRMGRLFLAMRNHPRPIVAAVQGRALAGGCGLATACDMILADEDARFGFPEIHLGFVPAMVMTLLRRKVVEGAAFELVSMGRVVGASEAHRMGLVNRILPAESFDDGVAAFVGELASRPPSALSLTKGLLYGLDALSVEDGIGRGAEVNTLARMTRACREGVREFLDRKREKEG